MSGRADGSPTETTGVRAMPGTWRAVLEGAEADRVRDLAGRDGHAAALALLEGDGGFGLAAGAAGAALLIAELGRAGLGSELPTSEQAAERAASIASIAVAGAARGEAPHVLPGLWSGIAGLRWLLLRLGVGEREADYDGELLSWVSGRRRREWDLIGGVTGVGVTGLELAARGRGFALLDAVIERLATLATEDADGVSWPPADRTQPRAVRDLGVAHGQLGAIGLLAEATDRPGGRQLLQEAVRWLMQRIQPPPAVAAVSYFAGVPPGGAPPTRLAWCYGDAGAAVVLARAGAALEEPEVTATATAIALRAADRAPETAGVVDAGLCHGASGLGHLFGRLWQTTGEERCHAAAVRWLRRVPALRERPGVDGLYPEWEPQRSSFRATPGVLTGSAGVCLALLAAASDAEPTWDRLMLAC
ncbi:MAG: lanthionine synthetase LanC family protein [Solirubrobacteraceae bacterium]